MKHATNETKENDRGGGEEISDSNSGRGGEVLVQLMKETM